MAFSFMRSAHMPFVLVVSVTGYMVQQEFLLRRQTIISV